MEPQDLTDVDFQQRQSERSDVLNFEISNNEEEDGTQEKQYRFEEFEGEDREDHSFIEVESLITPSGKSDQQRTRKILFGSISIFLIIVIILLVVIIFRTKEEDHKVLPSLPLKVFPLVIISIDGFRWDYLNRGLTPHLNSLASGGAKANFTTPQFPSKTFPNHYTIVTGVLPEYSGVISNTMYDPVTGQSFSIRKNPTDYFWYWSEPIWVTAKKNNKTTACYLYPVCGAPIQGILPDANIVPYVDTPAADVIDGMVEWIDTRHPDLTLGYFSEVDHAGHSYGPNSTEVNQALKQVDDAIGTFINYLKAKSLYDSTNIVIVSDHGMTELSQDRVIYIDKCINVSLIHVVDFSPVLTIFPLNGTEGALSTDEIYNTLKDCHPSLEMYRKETIPEYYYFNSAANPRIPPIIGIVDLGWYVTTESYGLHENGDHGYDPSYPDMFSMFIGHGPNIKSTSSSPSSNLSNLSFKNLDFFNFFTSLLNLTTDGNSLLPQTNSTNYLKDLIYLETPVDNTVIED